jgi:hypothetical protein
MLTNLYLFVLTLSFGSNHDTTIIGKAWNAKGGAMVVAPGNHAYYIDGLTSWDKKFYGKKVKVTGTLIKEFHKEEVNDSVERAVPPNKVIIQKPK